MSGPTLYTGAPKLVLAFDIGTTYSSVSYCILQPHQIPEVLPVARQVIYHFLLSAFDRALDSLRRA